MPPAQRVQLGQAISRLIAETPGALQRAGWQFGSMDQATLDGMAANLTQPGAGPPRLSAELTRATREGATGPYLTRLRSVQAKTSGATHVEIRGCEVGQDVPFLDAIRAYFGRPGNEPSVSAPDLFQYYFQLSFTTYPGGPGGAAPLTADWQSATVGLPQSFEDSRRIRAREMVRVTIDSTLAEVSARYGLNAALLETLNPQIRDPNALNGGDIVWLKAPGVLAGSATNLSDVCRTVLGNEHLWPRIWSFNPQIADAANLQPSDWIWLVSEDVRQRAGQISSPPTLAELQAAMAGGEAFVSVDRGTNLPTARMSDARRATAIASWLASQRFDPRGRTAQALSRLYAGQRFGPAMQQTFVTFLSRTYPTIEDPIWPDDPRFPAHFIHRP